MKVIAFDTETERFKPGAMAPRLVCVSVCVPGGSPYLLPYESASEWFLRAANRGVTFVGHSLSYDTAVLMANFPELTGTIFELYRQGRFLCTAINEKLLDIGDGNYRYRVLPNGTKLRKGYSLADVYRAYTNRAMAKGEDTWRLRYGELKAIPIDSWPEDARSYALLDSEATAAVHVAQTKRDPHLKDAARQARYDFWLRLASNHGFRTSAEGVQALEAQTLEVLETLRFGLSEARLIKPNGSRDTKVAKALMLEACEEAGIPVKRTDGGDVSLDAEACENSGNALLIDYAALSSLSTVLKKDLKFLRAGVDAPVHTCFDIVATGRTSSSVPNIQNIRRLPGIRECFVPRPGYVFAQADYDGLELRTLAQVCKKLFGYSRLGDALNAGKDPHLMFAAKILRIPYETAVSERKTLRVKEARQLAKAFNFGKPGGLGTKNFQAFAKASYGVILTHEEIRVYTNLWFEEWPEIHEYHEFIAKLCRNPAKMATFRHLFSARKRGGASFCAAANSFFQGLGSDTTKHAGWLITEACYNDTTSPLYGCRIVNYIHDEFILEVPDDDRAEAAANELARLMILGAAPFLPDYPATTEPLLMRYWSKDAQRIVIDGKLRVWEG